MGQGKLTGWTGRIRPFFDRPDIEIEVVFYGVPDTAPPGPLTVFTDRFYDATDGWVNLGVGTVVGSLQPYFGAVPAPGISPQIGTDADFVNGISYAEYLAGAVGDRCFVIDPPTAPVRLRQIEYFTLWSPSRPLADQGGVLVGGSDSPLLPPLLTDQGGVLVGGSDSPLLPPLLTDQGGVLVGGSDSPVAGPVCSNCPGGLMRAQYRVKYNSVGAGTCSNCTPLQGTHVATVIGPCSALSGTITLCGNGYQWFISIAPGPVVTLALQTLLGADQAVWTHTGSWDCASVITMTLAHDYTGLCNWSLSNPTIQGI